MKELTQHIPCGEGTLCGTSSWAAVHRTADCRLCGRRMDEVLGALLDAAEGDTETAKDLVRRLKLTRKDV